MGRADAMAWIKNWATRAKHITSVCTGSMILAKAGLLKGRQATSHWVTRAALADSGAIPAAARVVPDGNILTGGGVSAGLDFAAALVEMLRGRPYAQSLMLQAEYAPQPPFVGGTLATTPPGVGKMMDDMFAPVSEMFRAVAKPQVIERGEWAGRTLPDPAILPISGDWGHSPKDQPCPPPPCDPSHRQQASVACCRSSGYRYGHAHATSASHPTSMGLLRSTTACCAVKTSIAPRHPTLLLSPRIAPAQTGVRFGQANMPIAEIPCHQEALECTQQWCRPP